MYAYPYIEASLGRREFVLGSGYGQRHKAGDTGLTMQRLRPGVMLVFLEQNGIDFGLRSRVDVPALDITNRV
jgi:hypothetical protein